MSTVTITEKPLALEDLLAIVDGAEVELAADARTMIAPVRTVVSSPMILAWPRVWTRSIAPHSQTG